MAQGITLISGSPLIGCPTVYSVQPEAYNPNHTFHRIMLRIYAALETDTDYTTFDFSKSVENKANGQSYITQPAQFDISSALQAVADKYAYDAVPPTRYPYIKFRVEAWDEWMVDGNISTNQGLKKWPYNNSEQYQLYAYSFMGSFTDLERMNASLDGENVEYLNITYLSRKPNTSPEIVFKGCGFVYPGAFNRGLECDYVDSGNVINMAPTDGPKSIVYTPNSLGSATVGGHNLYVINQPSKSYVVRFINGMGCMESIHVVSFAKREVDIKTDKYVIAKQETLKKFSRSVVRKSNDRDTWNLTSGSLDREWTSWYIHDFMMSEQVWIQMGTLWIPCHVVPEETTLLEDQTKGQPYEVQFRLEMDINGSPI